MSIKEILDLIKNDDNFKVLPAKGLPSIMEDDFLPLDMKEFYELCGGIDCYISCEAFPISILPPEKVKSANEVIFGEQYEDDISSKWYVIAYAEDGNYISIDLSNKRLGRCYESFEFSHAIVGACPIIALSFTEILNKIIQYSGDYFFWKEKDFINYGDAYKEEMKEGK